MTPSSAGSGAAMLRASEVASRGGVNVTGGWDTSTSPLQHRAKVNGP
eukprot:CAMPEP_0170340626 /NCGR_PEP_ID=MMETSP0116_2-20130129/71422_1 /TAXON_ID=400756 /ORGANISM="Durinskia baltica, Strain CSIRO CS-38" /LENGTH=46 /DNA_ID= /DNA_START= /DNA_END= /DNA_ORIENTATION=